MQARTSKIGKLSAAAQAAVSFESLRAYTGKPADLTKFQWDKGPRIPFERLEGTPSIRLKRLDVQKFATAIRDQLVREGTNFAMQVNEKSKCVFAAASGYAQTPADDNIRWTPATRQHLASCSKPYTAATLIKLMKQRGIGYDDKIAPYLPAHWTLSRKAKALAFRAILTHQSGLWDSHCTYAELKQHLATVDYSIGEGFHYSNSNYALMRLIIPVLAGLMDPHAKYGELPGIPDLPAMHDAFWDALTRKHFDEYSQANLWRPAGVTFASLRSNQALRELPPFNQMEQITNAALAYPYPLSNTTKGHDLTGDCTAISGAVGWHLSVNEMLLAGGALRRGNIFSRAAFKEMCEQHLGTFCWETTNGPLYYHDGTWSDGSGHGQVSLLAFLPSNREIAILSNQRRDPGESGNKNLIDVVHDAFMAAVG